MTLMKLILTSYCTSQYNLQSVQGQSGRMDGSRREADLSGGGRGAGLHHAQYTERRHTAIKVEKDKWNLPEIQIEI